MRSRSVLPTKHPNKSVEHGMSAPQPLLNPQQNISKVLCWNGQWSTMFSVLWQRVFFWHLDHLALNIRHMTQHFSRKNRGEQLWSNPKTVTSFGKIVETSM